MTAEQTASTTSGTTDPTATPATMTLPRLTIYSTPWCGYCHRLMKQLDREGVAYDVVDIEQVPSAADFVMSVNGGNQTVPTVVFPDGTALMNPTLAQVRARLAA